MKVPSWVAVTSDGSVIPLESDQPPVEYPEATVLPMSEFLSNPGAVLKPRIDLAQKAQTDG